jgi:hypothetical protein
LIERDEVVTSGVRQYCIMARAPFTRVWRSVPPSVTSWLVDVEAASSSPNASVAASVFRVHTPGAIEADGLNGFACPFPFLRLYSPNY